MSATQSGTRAALIWNASQSIVARTAARSPAPGSVDDETPVLTRERLPSERG